VSRLVRFLSMIVFFGIFLTPKYYKSGALLIFAAFVINDLLLISFENFYNQSVVLFIRLCAYLLLAKLVMPYLKRIKIKAFEGVVFAGIILMNFLLLYYIKDSVNVLEHSGWMDSILFYGYGTSLILSVAAAFTFYSRYIDKASIFFLLSLLGLVLSDLTFFIGFYLDFPEFYYLDRGFNIVAIGFLLHFLFLFKRKIARNFYEMAEDKI
jgi:Kef-type K+ transport system membrane component KefB